jgi:hypothetical protein
MDNDKKNLFYNDKQDFFLTFSKVHIDILESLVKKKSKTF